MEQELIEIAGERCDEFYPGCPCCDIWEAFDLGAYGAVRARIDEVKAWLCEESLS